MARAIIGAAMPTGAVSAGAAALAGTAGAVAGVAVALLGMVLLDMARIITEPDGQSSINSAPPRSPDRGGAAFWRQPR